MNCSKSLHISEPLSFRPRKIFVRYPSYITTGIGMNSPAINFSAICLNFGVILPCSSKRAWEGIGSPGADIADKMVNFTPGSLIVFLLHIALEIFVINFTCVAIDDSLVKIYQSCVQMPLNHKLRASYQ